MNEKIESNLKGQNSTQIIFDAVHDLHNQEQIVTRTTLATILDMKIGIIDDRLSHLVDTGKIIRVERGVYVPVIQHPPSRLMSKTVLPDGTVKIDIGDDVLTLTPKEARSLGSLMAAEAMQFCSVEMGHQMTVLHQEVIGQVRSIKHVLKRTPDTGKKHGLDRDEATA